MFLLLDVVNNTPQPSGCLILNASWTSAHEQMRRLLSRDDFAAVVWGISWQLNLSAWTWQCPGTITSAGGHRQGGRISHACGSFLVSETCIECCKLLSLWMSSTCPISTMDLSKVPDGLLQPAVHQKLDPKTAHACICVTISHTIGLAVPLALPLAERLSCQRHKSSTFGTGKRFGSEENSYWTIALPAECPGLTFLLHHYSHVPPSV